MASASMSPAKVPAATIMGPSRSSQRAATTVNYINGLNTFRGLKAHNNVVSLGLPQEGHARLGSTAARTLLIASTLCQKPWTHTLLTPKLKRISSRIANWPMPWPSNQPRGSHIRLLRACCCCWESIPVGRSQEPTS